MNYKTLICCYKDCELVPFDDGASSAEFEFELVSEDYVQRVWYNAKYPPSQMRYFDTPLREYLLERGCSCCDEIGSRCDVCDASDEERYEELLHRGYTPLRIENAQSASPSSLITAHRVGVLNEQRCNGETNRIHTDIPIRVHYWAMKGSIKIDACFYKIINNFKDVNFGTELLDRLNADLAPLNKGRHIVNSDGCNIVRGSLLLRRQDARDGSIPHNSGNILIGDKEYLYEQVY